MPKKKQTAKSETKNASKPKAATPAVQPAAAPSKYPAPKAMREERNGVKHPKPGGKCAAV